MADLTDSLAKVLTALRMRDSWAWDRTVICHPDDEAKVQAALDALPDAHRRVRVLPRTVCYPGEAFLINDEAIEFYNGFWG